MLYFLKIKYEFSMRIDEKYRQPKHVTSWVGVDVWVGVKIKFLNKFWLKISNNV